MSLTKNSFENCVNIACNSSNGSTIDSGINWLYVGAPVLGSPKKLFITNISNNF